MANNRLLQKVLGIQYRMLRADFKLKLNRNPQRAELFSGIVI